MARILIVEDNEKNRKLFKFIISSLGYEVLTANDGKEGLRIAAEYLPALILMDIKMPVMDGNVAMRALRADEKTRRIPVIAVTAYAMKGDRERFLAEGFADYIAKPVEKGNFIKVLQKVLKEKKDGGDKKAEDSDSQR